MIRKITLSVMLLILLNFGSPNFLVAQVHTTLQPDSNSTMHATIRNDMPSSQHPNRELFQCSAWTQGGAVLWRSLMQFDLSAIPSSATVDSAFISLFGYVGPSDGHSTLSGSNESELMQITSAWNEYTVTWSSQPTYTTAGEIILPAFNVAGQDYLHINITNFVQYWVSNPSNNFGVYYKLQNEQYYRRVSWHSPGSSDNTKRPILDIYYTYESPQSVNENFGEVNVSIFPNPATSELTVSSSEFGEIEMIEIYSSLGEKVFSEPETSNPKLVTVNVSTLTPGIYFITVTDQARNKVTKKVVKI